METMQALRAREEKRNPTAALAVICAGYFMEAAPFDRGGIASGVVNAARQAGGVLGVAILGSLVSARADFIGGLQAGLIIAAAAFLTGAAVTARGIDAGAHQG